MRIATWNVNSLNARLPRVEEWIDYARPDVVCMQETKVADTTFPALALSALGYESAPHGDGRWNGVAIVSRVGLDDVQRGFGTEADEQGCRLVAATCGGVRVHSVYVPNGRVVGGEHYEAKLAWMGELRSYLESNYSPSDPVAVCGDFNVAPDDRDIYDRAALEGSTHITEPERQALNDL
jgi:exodeoxyribonuclease III